VSSSLISSNSKSLPEQDMTKSINNPENKEIRTWPELHLKLLENGFFITD